MNLIRRCASHKYLLFAVVLAGTLLSAPGRANAHAKPTLTDPAADSTVAAPSVISVTFTEPVEGKFSSLKVNDQHGTKCSTATSVQSPHDPKTLPPTLPPASRRLRRAVGQRRGRWPPHARRVQV